MSENPTREGIAQDAMDIIRYTHDTLSTVKPITEATLEQAIRGMTRFFQIQTPKEEKIPYQYLSENQDDFEKYQVVISSATDKVAPVIADMNERMFRLEKNQPVQQIPLSSIQAMSQPQVQAPQEEKQKSKLSLFPSKPTKPEANPTDPFQSWVTLRKKIIDLIPSWQLVVEWQSGGMAFFDEDGDHDLDRYGYNAYLSNHAQIWNKDVKSILQMVYSAGLNIILLKEKELSVTLGTSMMKEAFQTRMDFPTG